MKKTMLIILIALVGLMVLYVVFNLFDAPLSKETFKEEEVPPATLDKSNGFYVLWALGEPLGTDITSDTVIEKYRKLVEIGPNGEPGFKNFDTKAYKEMFNQNIGNKMGPFLKAFKEYGRVGKSDLCAVVLAGKKEISPLPVELKVLLDRYSMMIERPVFQDFSLFNYEMVLPNLIAAIRASRLFSAVQMLDALEGNWDRGVSRLLDQMDFAKRAIKGSRILITGLIMKAIMQNASDSLIALMNYKDCPNSVYEMILQRLTPLKYEEFGTENAFKCEALGFAYDGVDYISQDKTFGMGKKLIYKLLMQKNRTKNFFTQFFREIIRKEKEPPYLWKDGELKWKSPREGFFWWLNNPGGKLFIEMGTPNLFTVVGKSYLRKAIYDMIRISAELHLRYDPNKPVQEILNSLDSYRVLDDCSGKPYKWNDRKQLLYSVGIDRVDNGGDNADYQRLEGMDYSIPVILYVK